MLTASGGPFRGRPRHELHDVTPAQALAHPTWDMGRMVTTNSATLVNKGLEVIEAHLLFDLPFDRIDVVVHPQSIVHSMVEFTDGSTLAQCSPPDMRLPIALGLGWPDRVPGAAAACDWSTASTWEFLPLDDEAFPAVGLARRVGSAGSTYPAVYNAANEECVDAFHEGRIRFTAIVDTVDRRSSTSTWRRPARSPWSDVLEAERWARARAHEILEGMTVLLYALGVLAVRRGSSRRPSRCTRSATSSPPRSSASRSPSTWWASARPSGRGGAVRPSTA